MLRLVLFLVSLAAWTIRALFLSQSELLAENLALRQQVCALKRERPRPPLDDVLTHLDRKAACAAARRLPPCRAPPQASLFA